MKNSILVFIPLFCMHIFPVVALGSSTNSLNCEASYQPNGPSTDPISKKLEIIEQSDDQSIFKDSIDDFHFKVTWHKSLTTLYMTIHEGQNQLVFSTS
jgi:hypothetical protein